MKRLLVLFIDAFRYDYLSEENTPFLHSLSKNGFCAPIKPILGYTDAIKATIFTGVYPQDNGYWIMYKYCPETSPFRLLRHFRFIDLIPSDFIVSGIKFILSTTICRLLAKIGGYAELSTHNIPFSIIGSFDWTLKSAMLSQGAFDNYPTFFEVLKKQGVKYSYVDCSQFGLRARFCSSTSIRKKLQERLAKVDHDTQLIFIYLHQLDHFAHRHGTSSAKFLTELKNMDETIELTTQKVEQRFGDRFGLVIFSDHGMADTSQFLNPKKLMQDKGFGKDFLLFFDSTMVRVWYLNSQKKEDVRKMIEDMSYGSFLSAEERQELKLDFNHRYYGDDIYLLKPGYSIFPNFISWIRPYAMHAYHPEDKTQLGIFMFTSKERHIKKRDSVQVVDLAPTILDFVGLDRLVHYKASSLLE